MQRTKETFPKNLSSDIRAHTLSFLPLEDQRRTVVTCKGFFAVKDNRQLWLQAFKNEFGFAPAFEEDMQDQLKMAIYFRRAKDTLLPQSAIDEIKALLEKHKDKNWINLYLGLIHGGRIRDPLDWNNSAFGTNLQKQVNFLGKAAKEGDYQAAYWLILEYAHIARSRHFDFSKSFPAISILEKAVDESNFLDGLHALCLCYLVGIGVEKNDAKAEEYALRALLENLDESGVDEIARQYVDHTPDYQKAINFLEPLFAIVPTISIALWLGSIYDADHVQDLRLSRKWYLHAYLLGDSYAAIQIADIYHRGVDIEYNPHKAIQWYTRAFNKGRPNSAVSIASCIRHSRDRIALEAKLGGREIKPIGETAAQELDLMIHWLKKGARAGSKGALYELSELYVINLNKWTAEQIWWILAAACEGGVSSKLALEKEVSKKAEEYCFAKIALDITASERFAIVFKESEVGLIEKFKAVGESEGLLKIGERDIGAVLDGLIEKAVPEAGSWFRRWI